MDLIEGSKMLGAIPFVDITEDSAKNIVSGKTILDGERDSSYRLFRNAVENIKVIRKQFITCTAMSFGKDSTVTLLAAITAHIELMEEGVLNETSPLVVSHINTGVENHLMEMLALAEMDRLKTYCKQKNINLDLRVGRPPLAQQWASLFLSGLKIISVARNNNDCSVVMKIDNARRIERGIERDYKGKVVTLLGSRLDESAARKAKMKRKGTDKVTVSTLIDGTSADERVFAPIMEMSDGDIWNLIRGAGKKPIVDMGFDIESWGENHRLLNLIYKDSKDGACQYSAKKIKGSKASAGGCGGSARTGCSVCCKSVTDKSGEAQAKQLRHSVISGNILKVRNYMMYVAQNIEYRTYHSRAVDETTGAIALQPNVLKAEIIDELLWLLSQATFDDFNRAERFKFLVGAGREMEDLGYSDIVNDMSMDAEDRKVLAETYKKYAQRHLVRPMGLDIAIYLSAIHSRDGIRLPPNRAVWIWNEVEKGARKPYPEVDPRDGIVSDIPDAIMAMPSNSLTKRPLHEFDFLSVDDAESCEIQVESIGEVIPKSDARILLGESVEHDVKIRGLVSIPWGDKIRAKSLSKPRRIQMSKRAILARRKRNGKTVVHKRGRTSLDKPSFSQRSVRPHLEDVRTQKFPLYVIGEGFTETLNLDPEHDNITGYDINLEGLYNWLDYGGMEAALKAHDDAVEINSRHDGHMYFYGGLGAFRHYARYGVLRLNKPALDNTKRILQRTDYFSRIGVLSIDESAIVALSKEESSIRERRLSEYRKTNSRGIRIEIESVLPMEEYRSKKAEILLRIRKERNSKRKDIKQSISLFESNALVGAKEQFKRMLSLAEEYALELASQAVYSNTLLMNDVRGFDSRNYENMQSLSQGCLMHIFNTFCTDEGVSGVIDREFVNRLKACGEWQILMGYTQSLAKRLDRLISDFIGNHLREIDEKNQKRMEDVVLQHVGVRILESPVFEYKRLLKKPAIKQRKISDVLNIEALVA